MSRWKLGRAAGVVLCCAAMCLSAAADSTHTKKPKKPQLPTLPSGPTGRAVPQMPLDSIKPIAPQVTFQNGQLTIDAPNSTLADVLRAVKKQTNADIEIPDATDRVATHLGPGPARAVVAELLNGSKFNYVLLGSPDDPNLLTKVVLVAKSGPDNPAGTNPTPANAQGARAAAQEAQDTSDADADDANMINTDDTPEPPAAAAETEPPASSDQQGVKTPQQMLQEMQQRQMQFQQQQQQQAGQPQPAPGTPAFPQPGMPQRPPHTPQTPPDQ